MRWQKYINEEQIRKTIEILKPDNELFEVRILGGSKKNVLSAYFDNADDLLEQLDRIDPRGKNIYITLNALKDELRAREQAGRFVQNSQTTSDGEVTSYKWLFIDLDPVRATGISSSKEEFEKAKKLAIKVYDYMNGLGFEKPVKAISGNGFHLLYRINLENNPDNVKLIDRCLKVLATLFDTDSVKVDTSNYNPSRICKFHGTLAQKGKDIPDRPFRMSRIFSDERPEVNRRAFLEKLAAEIPEQPRPKAREMYVNGNRFDLMDFMLKNGITYSEQDGTDCKIYRLDECPFDRSHKNGDSKIFHYFNGAIAFKCHHNSCRGKMWQDVRTLYDPDAYATNEVDDRIDRGWAEHNRYKKSKELNYVPPIEESEDNPIFLTAEMILSMPDPEEEYIKSGIYIIDKKMKGLIKKGLSVVSGLRGSAKSTLMNQIALNAVQDGHTVIYYSGELSNKNLMKWIFLNAAGKSNLIESKKYPGHYDVQFKDKQKIAKWLSDNLLIYNNRYGNQFNKIITSLRSEVIKKKADLVIIDNLMALDLSSYDKDKYEAQTKFVWQLKQLAEDTNTHVIFVAHPRKAVGFLRLTDISGSGNIANIVDNAFIVHRINEDFKKHYPEYFGKKSVIPDGSNTIEIAKDRQDGNQDVFIPIWYEPRSKRLLNTMTEHNVYAWENADGFSEVTEQDYKEIPF